MAEEKKEFTIKDRRMSFEETRKEGEKSSELKTTDAPPEEESIPSGEKESEEAAPPLPEINFSTFIFSLNSSALVHLGVLGDPGSGARSKNLPFAKQTIDILGMLEEKTRGNLTKEEDSLLKNILHDLRLMYVRERG